MKKYTHLVKRFFPLLLIISAMILVFALDLDSYVSLAALGENEAQLKGFVAQAPVLTGLIFIGIYTVAVALSLPVAAILTLSSGLIFGTFLGGFLTIIGATLGACGVFVATKSAIGDSLRDKAGPRLKQFEEGFARDAVSYLLIVRFIPIFPFFIVNIAAALVGAPFWAFALTTAFGIAPGTLVYASLGNGISVILSQGGTPNLGIIFTPEVLLPLCALGLLSLSPILIRKIRQPPPKNPKTLKTDICVIGAGAGGLSVAAGAAQMGADTILIERGLMGGDCLNYGCVPSKALLAAAQSLENIEQSSVFGVSAKAVKVDYKKTHKHVHDVIAGIAPHDSVERFEGLGVTVLQGEARFLDAKTVQVGDYTIRARRFVVATGTEPFIPPITGLDQTPYLTNETIFDLTTPPEHLIVIGGGPIGVEMAQAHQRLGVQVTLVEADKLLARADRDAAEIIKNKLIDEGVEVLEGVSITQVKDVAGTIHLTCKVKGKGKPRIITGSHLLVATGRKPNLAALDYAKAGIIGSKSGLQVDSRLRTSNKKIFAIGDVIGGAQFTHVAGYHAGIVIRNALFRLPAKAQHNLVPQVTYCDPELAQIGLSEDEARTCNMTIRVLRSEMAENDRARAERSGHGFVKIITNPKGKILGVTIVGKQAGDLLAPWILALSQGLHIGAMAGLMLPYPTRGEAGKQAAGSYYTATLFGAKTRRLVRFLRLFG